MMSTDLECRVMAQGLLISDLSMRLQRLEIALESTRDHVDILQSLLAEHMDRKGLKNVTEISCISNG